MLVKKAIWRSFFRHSSDKLVFTMYYVQIDTLISIVFWNNSKEASFRQRTLTFLRTALKYCTKNFIVKLGKMWKNSQANFLNKSCIFKLQLLVWQIWLGNIVPTGIKAYRHVFFLERQRDRGDNGNTVFSTFLCQRCCRIKVELRCRYYFGKFWVKKCRYLYIDTGIIITIIGFAWYCVCQEINDILWVLTFRYNIVYRWQINV